MTNIAVAGASGHAKVIIDIIEKQGIHSIVGLIDSYKEPGTERFGYKVLGHESRIGEFIERLDIEGGIVAIGDNRTRGVVVERILRYAPEFRFISAIHPSANIAGGAIVGRGTAIMAGVSVNCDTRVGDHCILNTHSCVDYENRIGDYATLGPGAVTGEHVVVGDYSAVLLGAVVARGVSIGADTIIAAGATVLEDVPGRCVAVGSPARVTGTREPDEPYL